jgi:putative flippase GtrA
MLGRLGQPAKFIVVGICGFGVNLLAFTGLFDRGTWYLAASALAFMVSNAAMYVGNRYFTFGLSHDGFLAAYVRYALVGGVVAVLTALLLAVFVEGLELDPRVGQALALCLLIPIAFVLSKHYAFRLNTR